MKRRGLGKGLGKGYKNIVPRDPFIHGLSAKGISTVANPIINRKIVDARQLTKKEVEDEGWLQSTTALVLDDGTLVYPSQDDEGNNAGALFGKTADGETVRFGLQSRIDAKGKNLNQLQKERMELIKELEIMEQQPQKGELFDITEKQLKSVNKKIAKHLVKQAKDVVSTYDLQKGEKVIYHVFKDGTDRYTDSFKKALDIAQDWEEQGYENIRIWSQVDNGDNIVDVDNLYSVGEFPS